MPVTLDDVRRAREAQDPMLASLVRQLATPERRRKPQRSTALTAWDLSQAHRPDRLKALDREQRRLKRVADWEAVERDDAEVPLDDRFKLWTEIEALDADGSPWARGQLLEIIATVPLYWGPWRALKRLFKKAEESGDRELFGALTARIDHDLSARRTNDEVRAATLRYLVRRAWRHLRKTGELLPGAYADAASEVLRFYPENTHFRDTWVANHIFHHEMSHRGGKPYARSRFKNPPYRPKPAGRAFPEAWRRSPRPLFSLLGGAQSETVRSFATELLKADFRTQLREVEPSWVAQLIDVPSASVHGFVAWLLDAVPRFEPGALRELGLHDAVLSLLDSPSETAANWAAGYARSHARDLDLEVLITLANSRHKGVRGLARDLLKSRDPRKEVGLDAWGRLLGTSHGHKLASDALREHFTARELTLEWFSERLLTSDRSVVNFAAELLDKVHRKKPPVQFWVDLLDHPRTHRLTTQVALRALDGRSLDEVSDDVLRRAVLCPFTSDAVIRWVAADRIPEKRLGGPFFKALADPKLWESDPFMSATRELDREWAASLTFSASLQKWALSRLVDHRTFGADDLGFTWLFELVQRTDPELHAFAKKALSRSFHPSHFADPEDRAEKVEDDAPKEADLMGKTFLFTGKLATMTRSQAQKMVKESNGKKASGVNGNLDFLVIGDEGSPLYGGGRKGSKQVKAEGLIEKGADLKIISETAFLQMLAGESVEVDEDAALAGCERLWKMLVSPGPVDAPLRAFALHYLRQHHAEIHMAETDRPLDPGAELPDVFLTFERAAELCGDGRAKLRELGLLWMTWELAKWSPPMSAIVTLCELDHPEVREFVEKALTADDSRKHRRYRLDPSMLTPEAVYRFCESHDADTRGLGMQLIGAHPRLAIPEELFRLTESPDRQVRSFVVRQLWSLYRDTHASTSWSAPVREGEEPRKPRPDNWPAEQEDIRGFLRRTLFGIPPARLPKKAGKGPKLPAWRAKVALIETARDLALEDESFARRISPLLAEFMDSTGAKESEACLVALTRIRARHGALTGGDA